MGAIVLFVVFIVIFSIGLGYCIYDFKESDSSRLIGPALWLLIAIAAFTLLICAYVDDDYKEKVIKDYEKGKIVKVVKYEYAIDKETGEKTAIDSTCTFKNIKDIFEN